MALTYVDGVGAGKGGHSPPMYLLFGMHTDLGGRGVFRRLTLLLYIGGMEGLMDTFTSLVAWRPPNLSWPCL